MSYMLKLPDERGAQLRQIAAAKNTTIPDLIADYVRAEIEAGTIPADLPGIEVAKEGESITIKAKGFEATIPAKEGPTLADLMRASGNAPSDPERKLRWIEGLAGLSGIKVKRAGNGVKLVSPFTGKEYPLALHVASDLADQIDRAAE